MELLAHWLQRLQAGFAGHVQNVEGKLVALKQAEDDAEKAVETSKRDFESKRNPFARLGLFFKQIVAELRRVVTPTWPELLRYTGVVLVFVLFMMAFVALLDIFFGFGAAWLFGNGEELFPAPDPSPTPVPATPGTPPTPTA